MWVSWRLCQCTDFCKGGCPAKFMLRCVWAFVILRKPSDRQRVQRLKIICSCSGQRQKATRLTLDVNFQFKIHQRRRQRADGSSDIADQLIFCDWRLVEL